MAFRKPFIPPVRYRGRASGPRISRGQGGNIINAKNDPSPAFITINKVRSRSRARKKMKRDVYDLTSETNTDSDVLVSGDDESSTEGRNDNRVITEMHKNQNKSNISNEKTETQVKLLNNNTGGETSGSIKDNKVKNTSVDIKDNTQIKETYSSILTKKIPTLVLNEKEDENKIYKDKRAEFFLKRALWFNRDRSLDFTEYIKAINGVIGDNNILDVQIITYSKVELYIETEELATKLATDGITINGKKVRMFHMTKHPMRIYISGVKPWIDDMEIIYALKNIGYCEEKKLERITYNENTQENDISFGVRIMNICRRPETPLPKSVNLHVNGDIHVLGITPEYVTCYNCNKQGHISKNCLQPFKKMTETPNYITNYPEISISNKSYIRTEDQERSKITLTQIEKVNIDVKQADLIAEKKVMHKKVDNENSQNQEMKDKYTQQLLKDELNGMEEYISQQKEMKTEGKQKSPYTKEDEISKQDSIEFKKDIKNESRILNEENVEVKFVTLREQDNQNDKVFIELEKFNDAEKKFQDEADIFQDQKFIQITPTKDTKEKTVIHEENQQMKTIYDSNEQINVSMEQEDENNPDEQNLDTQDYDDNSIELEIEQCEVNQQEISSRIQNTHKELHNIGKIHETETNENILYMETFFKDETKDEKNIELLKNDVKQDDDSIMKEKEHKIPKKNLLEIRNWENYEETILKYPDIKLFFDIFNEGYVRKNRRIKTFTDQALSTFKLPQLIQTITDFPDLYDAYGKLGDVQLLIKGKLDYDRVIRNKLLKQRTTATNIANSLGYPADVEISIKNIKYWTKKFEEIEVPIERTFHDETSKVEDFIQEKIAKGQFPEDLMKEADYQVLGRVILSNIKYLRKIYKLRMLLNRMLYSQIGRKIVNKWDLKTVEIILRYIDVCDFKDLDIIQNKNKQGVKKAPSNSVS